MERAGGALEPALKAAEVKVEVDEAGVEEAEEAEEAEEGTAAEMRSAAWSWY